MTWNPFRRPPPPAPPAIPETLPTSWRAGDLAECVVGPIGGVWNHEVGGRLVSSAGPNTGDVGRVAATAWLHEAGTPPAVFGWCLSFDAFPGHFFMARFFRKIVTQHDAVKIKRKAPAPKAPVEEPAL